MSGAHLALLAAAAVLLAFAIDARWGEPPTRWHPVAWFGSAMQRLGGRLPDLPPALALIGGALAWMLGVGIAAASAWALQRALLTWVAQSADLISAALAAMALALALKPSFAWRMLREEVVAVDAALRSSLAAGRSRLTFLCSRDVAALDAAQVRETAIETLAENLNDSLVAPLFWFAVAGLPGAWAFRAANTLDAMWGYRGRWEWAGKSAARADDMLGWIPARITAALLWRPSIPWGVLAREAARTPSPNGGWPMAAMALRLGVRLSKPGVYSLHAEGAAPDAASVQAAVPIAQRAAHAAVALTALACIALRYSQP